ncbi:MAG: chromate efflux transporter [Rhizomicrobium sp.]
MIPERHSAFDVFRIFLRLGLTSFGGPIAHLGYFRRKFVTQLSWLDEAAYADLVGLCQFLPGPASSQVGFALGVSRAGWRGGIAAWLGFTLPSALLLFLFARLQTSLQGPGAAAALHGLKLVAVAVVAQAVWSMAKALTPDFQRFLIAAVAATLVSVVGGSLGQVGAILLGAVLGLVLCHTQPPTKLEDGAIKPGRVVGLVCLAIFFLFLILLPAAAALWSNHALAVFSAFYRSGALVFGGGHVVLPLLRDAVVKPGWISESSFLTGYGAAQAVPGPLFTVSAYLGAALEKPPNGLLGALLALIAIFLPGMLILFGALPFWHSLRSQPSAQTALRGINAAVVGILAAALYDPLWRTSVVDWRDALLAVAGFLLLVLGKAPPWSVVAVFVGASLGLYWLS